MSPTTDTPNDPLDRAVAAVRDEEVPRDTLEGAAARLADRLAAEDAAHRPIRGCADYQALLPALLAGELPEARALLVDEHSRHCLPCRRALTALRAGDTVADATAPAAATVRELRPLRRQARPSRRWLLPLAAALALATAGLGLLVSGGLPFGPAPVMAEVETLEGALLRLGGAEPDGAAAVTVTPGTAVREGERLKTAKGSGAVLTLADGSRIEMSERAELALDRGLRGTTIHLDRGRIIVEAAEQERGKLYVATEDCLVSVVGTVFSVNHGLKGSRVAVLDGEVRVAHGGTTDVLLPGQQVATDPTLAAVSLEREVGWSRHGERYAALLGELEELRREINARVSRPGLRFDSRLIELAPADTAVYLAAPNLSTTLEETWRVLLERVAESPELGAWWNEAVTEEGLEPHLERLVTRVRDLGGYLGEEVLLAVPAGSFDGGDEAGGPLLLAEVVAGGFDAYLAGEIERLNEEAGEEALVRVEDPALAQGGEGLLVWTGEGLLVATPSPALLAAVAELAAGNGDSGFAATDFGGRLSEAYAGGVEWLLGADLETLVERAAAGEGEIQEGSGFENLRHLLVERHGDGEVAETGALLTFDGPRRGIASWLAAPAPMASLDFVSAEAHLAGAVAFKEPVDMLADLAPLVGAEDFRAELDEIETELGVDLEADIAASLGGEMAFALDGPVLPTPSWKLVVEVDDPARLQAAIETLAERAAAHAAAEGARFEHSSETSGGRTFHTLRLGAGGEGFEAHYLFDGGYLVAAPSRALLERALAVRDSGAGLVASERFRALLPANGETGFSALLFQDLASLAEPLAGLAGPDGGDGEMPEGLGEIFALLGNAPATLGFAYGREDSIEVAFTSPGGPLGVGLWSVLPALAGVGVHGHLQGHDHGGPVR